jgi:glycosyltransferase involved in cell wall biosynthesis
MVLPQTLAEERLVRRAVSFWQDLTRSCGSAEACARRLRETVGETGGPVFVFPTPSVAWGYLLQRPQQLARALSKLGHTVLYGADVRFGGVPDRLVRGVRRLPEGPVLYADGRGGRMIGTLARSVVCWQYWPHQSAFRANLPAGSRLIYDCLDDLSTFEPYPEMGGDHAQTLARADLVIASSSMILEKVKRSRADAALVPNAAWYDDFANPARRDWGELDDLRRRSRVIVGYFGALGRWIDWRLLEELSAGRKDWTFLLVGDIMTDTSAPTRLLRRKNVKIWTRQPYARLGRLLSAFDVAVVPFLVNTLTESVSPIKLFEYMAGGKPIVSTPIPECGKYGAVRIAGSAGEFAREIEWCLGPGRSAEHRARLQACARENTWTARAKAVVELLETRGIAKFGTVQEGKAR